MTRTISIWEMYQRSRIVWRRLHAVHGHRNSARKRANGWPNGKTGILSPSEPSDAIAEQSNHAEVVLMRGLERYRPALPSGLHAAWRRSRHVRPALWSPAPGAMPSQRLGCIPTPIALRRHLK
jgi:hypothetical protein